MSIAYRENETLSLSMELSLTLKAFTRTMERSGYMNNRAIHNHGELQTCV